MLIVITSSFLIINFFDNPVTILNPLGEVADSITYFPCGGSAMRIIVFSLSVQIEHTIKHKSFILTKFSHTGIECMPWKRNVLT